MRPTPVCNDAESSPELCKTSLQLVSLLLRVISNIKSLHKETVSYLAGLSSADCGTSADCHFTTSEGTPRKGEGPEEIRGETVDHVLLPW